MPVKNLWAVEIGTKIDVFYLVDENEWQGNCSIEGKILHLEAKD
ncbi:MAG: hypothetical protein NT165_04080 [Candidatus Falkowbacteria bacterium]|nr:hypothetical protein [Candidatus Falkowbacteria bacterium]